MNLIHCLTGDVSCVGEARTYGRRCKRRIGRPRILAAYGILYTLANLDPLAAAASLDLLKAVDLLLCYQHEGQRSEVAEQWRDSLKEELRRVQKEGRKPDNERGQEHKEGPGPGHEAKQKQEWEAKQKQKERKRQEEEERKQRKQEESRRQQEEKRQREQEEKSRREKEERRRREQEKDRREKEARERSQRKDENTATQGRTPGWAGYLAQWKIIEAQEGKVRVFLPSQSICCTNRVLMQE